jgi:hypothetical protein
VFGMMWSVRLAPRWAWMPVTTVARP